VRNLYFFSLPLRLPQISPRSPQPILEIGASQAIQQMNYDFEKFILRDRLYDWSIKDD
jgi:hypothetical protein